MKKVCLWISVFTVFIVLNAVSIAIQSGSLQIFAFILLGVAYYVLEIKKVFHNSKNKKGKGEEKKGLKEKEKGGQDNPPHP